MNDERIIMPLQ